MGDTPTRFRALPTDPKKKKWVYGALVTINGKEWIVNEEGYYTEVRKDTVCFCTGVKDKNGETIYEGDILRAEGYPYYSPRYGYHDYYSVVKWSKRHTSFVNILWVTKETLVQPIFQCVPEEDFNTVKDMEIVGNIIENKDILGRYEFYTRQHETY